MIVNCIDGSLFEFPDLPVNAKSFSSFIILKGKTRYAGKFLFIPFNRKLESSLSSDGNLVFIGDGLEEYPFYSYLESRGYWELNKDSTSGIVVMPKYFDIFGFSNDLVDYEDMFFIGEFCFDWADYSSVMVSSLRDVDMTSDVVLVELFGVLPVLLVVLVSFIGIRKGISYLFSLLKKS